MFPSKEQVRHTQSLHSRIAEEQNALEAPWLGTLPFCMDLYGDGNFIDHANVFDFMKNTGLSKHVLRFSPTNYSPSTKTESQDRLICDICLASRENGVELIRAGGAHPPICKSLMCSCSLIVDKKHEGKENDSCQQTYRTESLHNDRKNNRPNGHQKQPRRCATKRRLSSKDPMCTFRLNITLMTFLFSLKLEAAVCIILTTLF